LKTVRGGEYLGLTEMKKQEDAENYIMRSFTICTFHQIL